MNEKDQKIPTDPVLKSFLRHLTYLITIGFFSIVIILFYGANTINPSEKDLISMLFGVLIGKWSTIIDFWFGSSRK